MILLVKGRVKFIWKFMKDHKPLAALLLAQPLEPSLALLPGKVHGVHLQILDYEVLDDHRHFVLQEQSVFFLLPRQSI